MAESEFGATATVDLSDHPILENPTYNSEWVKYLQTMLTDVMEPPTAIDGDFLDKTEAAVRAFQSMNGLTVDGDVGPDTWAALYAAHLRIVPRQVTFEEGDVIEVAPRLPTGAD